MPLILAIIVGTVLFVLFLKLVIGLIVLGLGLALAVIVYFTAEKLMGRGR